MADTILPVTSGSKEVDETVTLTEHAVKVLGLKSDKAHRVEKGEVESVIKVGKDTFVIGNEQIVED